MAGSHPISALLIIIITIFLPPLGVFLIAGCGADLLINICLTILGVLPGHIHAFYLEYVYFERRGERNAVGAGGTWQGKRAPGVYSERVQQGGGGGTTYGTVAT
ncbi:hypothetical protein ACLMJK_001268 [Lecanora helva]